MRLVEHPEWPKVWGYVDGPAVRSDELGEQAIFANARITPQGLMLTIRCKGRQCNAVFVPKVDPALVRPFRNRLNAYKGKPLREVEAIDIDR